MKRWSRLRWWLIKTIAMPCAHGVLKCILRTCTFDIDGKELMNTLSKGGCVLSLWHDALLLVAPFANRYAKDLPYSVVISKARDGQLLQRLIGEFPQAKAVCVSHSHRHSSLKAMLEAIDEHRVILITPDGPRGPAHEIKRGLYHLVDQKNCPVIWLSWTATKTWKLPTWDAMRLPKPFSKVTFSLAKWDA